MKDNTKYAENRAGKYWIKYGTTIKGYNIEISTNEYGETIKRNKLGYCEIVKMAYREIYQDNFFEMRKKRRIKTYFITAEEYYSKFPDRRRNYQTLKEHLKWYINEQKIIEYESFLLKLMEYISSCDDTSEMKIVAYQDIDIIELIDKQINDLIEELEKTLSPADVSPDNDIIKYEYFEIHGEFLKFIGKNLSEFAKTIWENKKLLNLPNTEIEIKHYFENKMINFNSQQFYNRLNDCKSGNANILKTQTNEIILLELSKLLK